MTLGQMKTLALFMDHAIDNYAAGNDAFEQQREIARTNMEIKEIENVESMPWTAFGFSMRDEHHTVVLNKSGDVIGKSVDRKR